MANVQHRVVVGKRSCRAICRRRSIRPVRPIAQHLRLACGALVSLIRSRCQMAKRVRQNNRKAALQSATDFLASFPDIQQNFDPSVLPLRKTRKIVLADSAIDGLL